MTPATTGKDFNDIPTLAPLRKRLGALASRNMLVGTVRIRLARSALFPDRSEYRGKVPRTRFEAGMPFEYA
jgi:hypothetical protein